MLEFGVSSRSALRAARRTKHPTPDIGYVLKVSWLGQRKPHEAGAVLCARAVIVGGAVLCGGNLCLDLDRCGAPAP